MGSMTLRRSAPRISSVTGRSASFPRADGGDRSPAGTSDSSVSDDRVTAVLPGLPPLGHRDYALYWVGQLGSMSGTWIELTATTWLLYQLTDSPLLLGLGGLFRAAPIFALALIGGAVAGLLIAQVGVASPFFVNAVSYFAIIVALLAMRIPPVAMQSRGSIRQDLVGGLRYVRASAILPLILTIEASLSVFGHNQALITIFARDVLGTDAQGLGLLLSAIGAGAIAGMVLLVIVGDVRRKGAFMLGAGVLYAGMLLVFAWSRSFPLSLAALALLGFADATWGTMRNAIAQLAAEDAYRGRVMSLIVIVSRGLTNASQLQTGIATALVGAPGAATIGALVVAAVVGAVATRAERLRHFTAPSPRPIARAAEAGGES